MMIQSVLPAINKADLSKLFKEIKQRSKNKKDITERQLRGFQKFRQLHVKKYNQQNYVKIFLGKQSMFDSQIIMKNIDA